MNRYSQKLNQIIEAASEKIEAMPISEMNYKPSPEKWSKKEILGHLIDSAYNNHQRVVRAERQENLIFHGYNQNDWVTINSYQNRTIEEVLNTWIVANFHLSAAVSNLSDALLNQKTKKHNFHQISMLRLEKESESSLSYLVWDYIYHLEHHLGQIIENYEPLNEPF